MEQKSIQRDSVTGRFHVIARNEGWAVKKEGSARAAKIYPTKVAAVKGASQAAAKKADVVVHRKDGSIAKWRSKSK